ncbi:MAG: hypothetical protein RL447_1082, partial [Bacteroidota bacterium]
MRSLPLFYYRNIFSGAVDESDR